MPYLLQKEYRRLYSAVLPRSQLVDDGILRASPMNALVSEHLSGRADHGNRLWLLLNAEVWYRMHIKNVSRQQLQADLSA
jgi:asparagine synthase (glutamine-hydrolysing)